MSEKDWRRCGKLGKPASAGECESSAKFSWRHIGYEAALSGCGAGPITTMSMAGVAPGPPILLPLLGPADTQRDRYLQYVSVTLLIGGVSNGISRRIRKVD